MQIVLFSIFYLVLFSTNATIGICLGNHMILSAILNRLGQVKFSVFNKKIHEP